MANGGERVVWGCTSGWDGWTFRVRARRAASVPLIIAMSQTGMWGFAGLFIAIRQQSEQQLDTSAVVGAAVCGGILLVLTVVLFAIWIVRYRQPFEAALDITALRCRTALGSSREVDAAQIGRFVMRWGGLMAEHSDGRRTWLGAPSLRTLPQIVESLNAALARLTPWILTCPVCRTPCQRTTLDGLPVLHCPRCDYSRGLSPVPWTEMRTDRGSLIVSIPAAVRMLGIVAVVIAGATLLFSPALLFSHGGNDAPAFYFAAPFLLLCVVSGLHSIFARVTITVDATSIRWRQGWLPIFRGQVRLDHLADFRVANHVSDDVTTHDLEVIDITGRSRGMHIRHNSGQAITHLADRLRREIRARRGGR